jgi:membrane protease YdiL (CAAX protease family)
MQTVDWKRIGIFVGFAFGIAWAVALVIALTGGLANSPDLGGGLTLALVLLTVGYMAAPALAHLLTRWVTGEGWQDLYLRPRFKQGWPYWLAVWLGSPLLLLGGAALFFVLFPQYFDANLNTLQLMLAQQAAQAGQTMPQVALWPLVIVQGLVAILIAPIVNALPILGEEFGWRAYLQPKLIGLGARKAMLLMGVIWGLWHAPVIAMGHNYGLEYPGAPWLGILAMTWFTFGLGTFLGWAVLRAGSVWPAVIGHGLVNGFAGIVLFAVQGQPNPILGPLTAGVIGSAGFALAALLLLLSRRAWTVNQQQTVAEASID